MADFMNPPVKYEYTEEDLYNDYVKYKSYNAVAKMYLMPLKEVKRYIKEYINREPA